MRPSFAQFSQRHSRLAWQGCSPGLTGGGVRGSSVEVQFTAKVRTRILIDSCMGPICLPTRICRTKWLSMVHCCRPAGVRGWWSVRGGVPSKPHAWPWSVLPHEVALLGRPMLLHCSMTAWFEHLNHSITCPKEVKIVKQLKYSTRIEPAPRQRGLN